MSDPSFDLSLVGVETDPVDYWVDRQRLQAYARAVGDPDPAHLAGDGANPVFHVAPAARAVGRALAGVVIARTPGLLGEIEVRSFAAPRPDRVVRTTATIVSVVNRSTGVVVSAHARTEAANAVCAEQYVTLFYRGARADADVGVPVALPLDASVDSPPDAVVETSFQPDVTYRYAGVVGDTTAVHLDSRVARALGLPGIILHGTCTLAMVLESVCKGQGLSSSSVSRVAARLDQWVQPTDRVWTSVRRKDTRTVGFSSRRGDGTSVLSRGVVAFM